LRKKTLRDRAFHTFFRMRRSLTLGVRGVVVDASGKVLLLRHTYTPGWHFPGGGVEKGETAAHALVRELKEEAGIEVTEKDLALVSIHANHAFFPNDHVLVFRVNNWRQGKATSLGEIAEIRFVEPLNPPADVSKGTNHRLKELFGAQAVSELW
jgi:8-oxo-dGTP pyrophosphatase MutT (NUDIX family)